MFLLQRLKSYLLLAVVLIPFTKLACAANFEIQKFHATEAKEIPPQSDSKLFTLSNEGQGTVLSGSVQNSKKDGLQSSILPRFIDSLKHVYNFMVTPRQTGTGKSPEDEHSITTVFCIFAFITFFSFLFFVLQPLMTYPKRRRIALSHGRRFRHYFSTGYPYNGRAYARKQYRHSGGSQFKHSAPSVLKPVFAPIPIASSFPATGPSSPYSNHESESSEASTSVKSIKKPKTPKIIQSSSQKEHDDELTKEEIMYILKTLDDE